MTSRLRRDNSFTSGKTRAVGTNGVNAGDVYGSEGWLDAGLPDLQVCGRITSDIMHGQPSNQHPRWPRVLASTCIRLAGLPPWLDKWAKGSLKGSDRDLLELNGFVTWQHFVLT